MPMAADRLRSRSSSHFVLQTRSRNPQLRDAEDTLEFLCPPLETPLSPPSRPHNTL
ncbi:hypothetical protein WN51_11725 [Melipona quadrifasciata]|uniref:Uncharacterized protein n=1 Tax=Melipona quadrifasciata TaxID=166423 RepID=A0A0N0U5Z6_9HYME|nr:hypothetical protein WN51_11725 [Melipona quadrifasciata]